MSIDFSQATDQIQNIIDGFVASLPNLIIAFLVFLTFYLAARASKLLVKRLTESYGMQANLGTVLGRLSQWIIVVLGLLVALVIIFPNFSPGQLLQLLGISSVAIGFAFRDILQNFVAGILLLLNEPFVIGDQIVVKGYEGTVENINTRATTITTYDKRRVVLPNTDLFTNPVTVNTAFDKRRVESEIGIGYGDDIEQARTLILETLRGLDHVLTDPPPDVIVSKLADASVALRVRWWITPSRRRDAMDTRDQVLAAIKATLNAHGIDLPFPTQQILFHDQTEETDGDRARQREGWPAGRGTVPEPRSIAAVIQRTQTTQARGTSSQTLDD